MIYLQAAALVLLVYFIYKLDSISKAIYAVSRKLLPPKKVKHLPLADWALINCERKANYD